PSRRSPPSRPTSTSSVPSPPSATGHILIPAIPPARRPQAISSATSRAVSVPLNESGATTTARPAGPGSATPAAPLLGADRPSFVVAPLATHLQVARREPLVLKAAPHRQGNRRLVRRLDVRLQAMETQVGEGPPDGEPDRLGHVALPRLPRNAPIADEPALEGSANDLADVHESDDRPVVAPAGHHRLEGPVPGPFEKLIEF